MKDEKVNEIMEDIHSNESLGIIREALEFFPEEKNFIEARSYSNIRKLASKILNDLYHLEDLTNHDVKNIGEAVNLMQELDLDKAYKKEHPEPQFRIYCRQNKEYFSQGEKFNNPEEIEERLRSFHEGDVEEENRKALNQMSLYDLLEYGEWEIHDLKDNCLTIKQEEK